MRAKFIYEKFTDDGSDPIRDMGIGLIHKLREEYVKIYSNNWHKINPEEVSLSQLLSLCLNNTVYDISAAETVIAAGAFITSYALLTAVNRGIEFVKLLLNRQKFTKGEKNKALAEAVVHKKLDIAELLLKNGADIKGGGNPALRTLVYYKNKNLSTIKWLLEKGANPNTHNYYCLKAALKNKDYELVDILIKYYKEDRTK